jgi:hypothetical protein
VQPEGARRKRRTQDIQYGRGTLFRNFPEKPHGDVQVVGGNPPETAEGVLRLERGADGYTDLRGGVSNAVRWRRTNKKPHV